MGGKMLAQADADSSQATQRPLEEQSSSPKSTSASDSARATLLALLESLGAEPTRAALEPLAGYLSMLVSKQEPWTWQYLARVCKANLPPSLLLMQALDECVRHPPRELPRADSMIMAKPKTCNCGRTFLPNVPWRDRCPVCSPYKR